MTKLQKIVTTLVLTAMLSLPIFAAGIVVRPNVSWSSGAHTNSWEWNG